MATVSSVASGRSSSRTEKTRERPTQSDGSGPTIVICAVPLPESFNTPLNRQRTVVSGNVAF